jgi:hypothetical protein
MKALSERVDPMVTARWIASFGLPTDERDITVADEDWGPLLGILTSERLTGLAVAAAEGGALHLSDGQADALLERHRDAMAWALMGERHLIRLGTDLVALGVEFVLLKGPALAHVSYADPSWRPYADLDLLVKTRDWRTALDFLGRSQFSRKTPEPRPGFDERFGKAATHIGPEGFPVDLHRTFVLGPFGLWMQPEELFETTSVVEIAGRPFRRLDDTALLIHACMHAALGSLPVLILPVRDVAQVLGTATVDWALFADRVARWRLGVVVQHAFVMASEVLGFSLPEETRPFVQARPSRTERRVLASYTSDRHSRGGTALSTFRAIPGLGGKAAYARALLFPQRSFVEARSGARGYFGRWRTPFTWMKRNRARD